MRALSVVVLAACWRDPSPTTPGPPPPMVWSSTTELPGPRSELGAAVYNDRVYVVGGFPGGVRAIADVSFAPIVGGGRLGAWKSTTPLAQARCEHAVVAERGFLYVLGGYQCGGVSLDDVVFAPIRKDGSLGRWTATQHFKTPRYGLQAVAAEGYMYVLGGHGPDGELADVQVAAIQPDGSLGPWRATSPFAHGRAGHGVVASGGRLYVIGGGKTVATDVPDGKAYSARHFADVQVATIRRDGSLDRWVTSPSQLAEAVDGAATVVHAGRVYVLGGNGDTDYLGRVQTAPIAASGDVGAWTDGAAFPEPRMHASAVVAGGYLYLLGGNTAKVTYLTEVHATPVR